MHRNYFNFLLDFFGRAIYKINQFLGFQKARDISLAIPNQYQPELTRRNGPLIGVFLANIHITTKKLQNFS